MKYVYLSLVMILFATSMTAQVYVDQDALGANNGTSWENAFTDVQDALSMENAVEIWIAEGIYIPTLLDTATYFKVEENHSLYGGFNGTETELDQRDPEMFKTIFEGDVNGDDEAGNFLVNKMDNAKHLLYIPAGLSSVLIDGIDFQGGAADIENNDQNDFLMRGGAIYSLSSVQIENCDFIGNSARSGGCVYILEGHSSVINACNFDNNYASSQGAGVLFNTLSEGTISACNFGENITNRGSVYTLASADINIEDCNFYDNEPHPDNWGCVGYFSWDSYDIVMEGCYFSGNTGGNASSIYVDGRNLDVHQIEIVDCIFEENQTTNYGGTVYFWRSEYTMEACEFSNNIGPNSACIYNGRTKFEISDSEFSGNVGNFGGVANNYNAETIGTFTNCTFSENTGETSGGACMVGFTAHVDFIDCVFEQNEALYGGCVYIQNDSTSANFISCEFIGNVSENFGGALASFSGSTLLFADCLFEGNQSDVGGALSCVDDTLDIASIEIDKCLFNFNIAYAQGGAVSIGKNDATIRSSLFINNFADDIGTGGALSNNAYDNQDSHIDIINSTFADNIGALSSGLAQFDEEGSQASISMLNTIMYNESGLDYAVEDGTPELSSLGGNLVLQSDLAMFLNGPQDSFDEDPDFVDPADFDFQIESGSPAVNAGIEDGAHETDLEGSPIVDGVDKGCYENQNPDAVADLMPEKALLQIMKNPAPDYTFIRIDNPYVGPFTLDIYDNNGLFIHQNKFQKVNEMDQFYVDVSQLPSGTYLLSVQMDGVVFSQRLIKI